MLLWLKGDKTLTDSHKILIVEDDQDIANIYSLVLQDEGYHTDVARNADEALAKVLDFHPDAVLMDIMIPGVDGLEVLRQIRTEARFTHIQPKIIVTTNIAQQDKTEIAQKYGAQGYLVKANIDPHDLGPIVQKLLSGSSADSSADPVFFTDIEA